MNSEIFRACSVGMFLASSLAACATSPAAAPRPTDLQSVLEQAERYNWGIRITTVDERTDVGRVSALDSSAVTVGSRTAALGDVLSVERERNRSGPLLIGTVLGTFVGLIGGGLYAAVTDVAASPTAVALSALAGLAIGAGIAGQSDVEWEVLWSSREVRRP